MTGVVGSLRPARAGRNGSSCSESSGEPHALNLGAIEYDDCLKGTSRRKNEELTVPSRLICNGSTGRVA